MTGKYRAWDKEEKSYVSTDRILINQFGRVIFYTWPTKLDDVTDRYDIEWETDKNDKDGVHIYQNDIVTYYNPINGETPKDRSGHKTIVPRSGLQLGLESTLRLQIIGTIHEEKGSE